MTAAQRFRCLLLCMQRPEATVLRCLESCAGMLCTISAAREKGHDMADVPVRCCACRPTAHCRQRLTAILLHLPADVLTSPLLQLHVYGPRGVAQFINAMLRVSDTYLLMPVVIHELSVQPPSLAGWPPHEVWHPAWPAVNRLCGSIQEALQHASRHCLTEDHGAASAQSVPMRLCSWSSGVRSCSRSTGGRGCMCARCRLTSSIQPAIMTDPRPPCSACVAVSRASMVLPALTTAMPA